MLQFEEFLDVFSAIVVIIIISIFITLAWMSTYVREQPLIATAVVVFQQESSPAQSLVSTPTTTTSACESSNEILNSQDPQIGLQSMATTSQESETYQSALDAEEVKALPQQTELVNEEKVEDSDKKCEIASALSISSDITNTKNTKEVLTSQVISGVSDDDKKSGTSHHLEPKPVPEEGYCKPSSSVLRNRSLASFSKEENSNKETENKQDLNDRTYEAEAEVHYENLSEESIRIKLKFLDDTQRLVRGQLTDEVGSFKRANFNPELASNRVVRLIFNGQLLNRDNSTLGQYGLFDNCVVHCHISQPQPTNSNEVTPNTANQENDGLDISEILSPLLLVVVAFLWYLRYEYSYIFTTSATIILICLTAILFISLYAFSIIFNVSWTYERRTNNEVSTNSQSTEFTLGIERGQEPRIQRDFSTTSSTARDSPSEEGATALLDESRLAADNSSKPEVSIASETPSTDGAPSFTLTNPSTFTNTETILLNS